MDAIGELFTTALPTLQKAVFSAPLNKGEGVPSKIVLERRGDIFLPKNSAGAKPFMRRFRRRRRGILPSGVWRAGAFVR